MINESVLNEIQNGESSVISGEQIADMFGMGNVYRKGKEKFEQEERMFENVKQKFAKFTKRMDETPKGMVTNFD